MQVNLTGDEAGPPRLARYLAARKEERERLEVLAAAGATDPLLYETPGARAPLVTVRSTGFCAGTSHARALAPFSSPGLDGDMATTRALVAVKTRCQSEQTRERKWSRRLGSIVNAIT